MVYIKDQVTQTEAAFFLLAQHKIVH